MATSITIHLVPIVREQSVWCDTHLLPHSVIIDVYRLTMSGVALVRTLSACD